MGRSLNTCKPLGMNKKLKSQSKEKEAMFFSYLVGFSVSSTCCSAVIKTILYFEERLFFFSKRVVTGMIDLDVLEQLMSFRIADIEPQSGQSFIFTQDGAFPSLSCNTQRTKYQISKWLDHCSDAIILWSDLTLWHFLL